MFNLADLKWFVCKWRPCRGTESILPLDFFFFFFNILCLVQSALFQGKVLVLWSHFVTALSWSHRLGAWRQKTRGLIVVAADLLPDAEGMDSSHLPDKDNVHAATSKLVYYCLKCQIFLLFS